MFSHKRKSKEMEELDADLSNVQDITISSVLSENIRRKKRTVFTNGKCGDGSLNTSSLSSTQPDSIVDVSVVSNEMPTRKMFSWSVKANESVSLHETEINDKQSDVSISSVMSDNLKTKTMTSLFKKKAKFSGNLVRATDVSSVHSESLDEFLNLHDENDNTDKQSEISISSVMSDKLKKKTSLFKKKKKKRSSTISNLLNVSSDQTENSNELVSIQDNENTNKQSDMSISSVMSDTVKPGRKTSLFQRNDRIKDTLINISDESSVLLEHSDNLSLNRFDQKGKKRPIFKNVNNSENISKTLVLSSIEPDSTGDLSTTFHDIPKRKVFSSNRYANESSSSQDNLNADGQVDITVSSVMSDNIPLGKKTPFVQNTEKFGDNSLSISIPSSVEPDLLDNGIVQNSDVNITTPKLDLLDVNNSVPMQNIDKTQNSLNSLYFNEENNLAAPTPADTSIKTAESVKSTTAEDYSHHEEMCSVTENVNARKVFQNNLINDFSLNITPCNSTNETTNITENRALFKDNIRHTSQLESVDISLESQTSASESESKSDSESASEPASASTTEVTHESYDQDSIVRESISHFDNSHDNSNISCGDSCSIQRAQTILYVSSPALLDNMDRQSLIKEFQRRAIARIEEIKIRAKHAFDLEKLRILALYSPERKPKIRQSRAVTQSNKEKDFKANGPVRGKRQKYITKSLHSYLINHLKPVFGFDAALKADELCQVISSSISSVLSKSTNERKIVDNLKKELANLNVIKTTFDFYKFIRQFLPHEFEVKVVPCVQPVSNIVWPPKDYNKKEFESILD